MNRNVLVPVALAVVGLGWWLWSRPRASEVASMQQRFVRVVCETDAVAFFANNVGSNDVQGLVGPISQERDDVFAQVRSWQAAAGTTRRERNSYRKLVGCDRAEIQAFDQAVTAAVQGRCPAKKTDLLPGLLTLLGVVAQFDA